MENGEIGEARTKSILIDRFWILERNVDINGTDLLIQRQLMERDFNNPKPSKLGIVQAKFRQSLPAKIELKAEYVFFDGKPRENFFLFVHTGTGNNKKVFFYTTEQLSELLDTNGILHISEEAKDISSLTTQVLDEIEKKLERMDLKENYRSLFSDGKERSYYHMEMEYTMHAPLSSDYNITLPGLGSFREMVADCRDKVDSYVSDNIEPLVELQKKINSNLNPIEISSDCQEFEDEARTDVENRYLAEAVQLYQQIEAKGLLNGLKKVCSRVSNYILNDLSARNEELYKKEFCYNMVLESANYLDEAREIKISTELVATPSAIRKKIQDHIEETERRKNEPFGWRYSSIDQFFDDISFLNDRSEITVNLSQIKIVASIFYYQKEIDAGKNPKFSFDNPKVNLDKAKGYFLTKLSEHILTILVNKLFSEIQLYD